MDKFLGKRLEGRYDILELVGKGGMANVYRAHDIIDDRTVAVKILREEFINNSDFLRRFKNESKAIAFLNHPNIVKVHDVSFSGIHYIVMEYIDGVTLKEYIDHTGALPWKDAVYFTIQILHALQHAHDKGIVHRDIKPQNIMLLRTGEIKVTDFGIARFARSESRTMSDRAIGSVHYISPEQAMGENTDERSDIYSTGIMLFEMLTGRLPFEADTAVSVAIKQVQTPIEKPRDVNPEIPEGLEEITLRAVQKDPRLRFQSAAEMISALNAFRSNPQMTFNFPSTVSTTAIVPTKTQMEPKHDKKRKRKKKPNAYLRIMFIVTIAVAIGSLGFMGIMVWMNNPFVTTGEGTLPNFIGESYDVMVESYPDYDLEIRKTEYNDEYNKGVIFEQEPRAGSRVKLGSSVKLTVSDGMRSITIDDYENSPAASVLFELRNFGLQAEEVRSNHDTIPAGRVISTDPPAGSELSGGDSITLTVSEGPVNKFMTIPDTVGMTLEAATSYLESNGFFVGSISEEASDLPEGTVSSQSPVGGAVGFQGTKINLGVSVGGLNRFYVDVPLPTALNRDITIRARVGPGSEPEIAAAEVLNPQQSESGYWSPSFAGEEGEELRIIIYIDGRLYQEMYLDFSTGEHRVTIDRRSAPEFQQ